MATPVSRLKDILGDEEVKNPPEGSADTVVVAPTHIIPDPVIDIVGLRFTVTVIAA